MNQQKPHNQKIKTFIKDHSELFWYTPEEKKEEISEEFLIETILNYGSLEAIKKIFELISIEKAYSIFINQTNSGRHNYFPPVKNFFDLYFHRHV